MKDSVSSLLQTLMVSVLCVVQVAVYSPPQSEPPTVVNKMALKCSVPSNCPGFTQRRKANIFKVIHLSLESDLSFFKIMNVIICQEPTALSLRPPIYGFSHIVCNFTGYHAALSTIH